MKTTESCSSVSVFASEDHLNNLKIHGPGLPSDKCVGLE